MSARQFLLAPAFLGGSLLLACTDGQLDVLERSPETGEAGAGTLPVSPFVLDDFEDGDTQSFIGDGYWYLEPDPTCTGYFSIEAVADRPGNTRAIRARGGGCTAWGALLGLDLRGPQPTFDTSSFLDLRLWARAEPGGVAELNVSLLEKDHFDTTIELTSEWREFVLPLDGFTWNDMGDPHPLDRTAVEHLQFFVFSASAFDFWLDDIAFTR